MVVFFCHQLVQILHLHSWWSSPATCTGGILCMLTSPFTDVHKHIWVHAHCDLHCVVVVVVVAVVVCVYLHVGMCACMHICACSLHSCINAWVWGCGCAMEWVGVHVHMCACVCMSPLFSPPPVSTAQSTHTVAASTLSVCSSLSEGTSCEWSCVG